MGPLKQPAAERDLQSQGNPVPFLSAASHPPPQKVDLPPVPSAALVKVGTVLPVMCFHTTMLPLGEKDDTGSCDMVTGKPLV